MASNVISYFFLGFFFTVYIILDGFELGVGAFSLFVRKEEWRNQAIRSIAPFWDGNEVWLISAGTILFAAFPAVYAAVFSGLYIAFYLLLFFLILRAVAIEVRGKIENSSWKKFWDTCFSISSIFIIILFGVTLGNLVYGLDVNKDGIMQNSFLSLLNPYSLLVGLFCLIQLSLHGICYLILKVEGEFLSFLRKKTGYFILASVSGFVFLFLATYFFAGRVFHRFYENPFLFLLLFLNIVSFSLLPRLIKKEKNFLAFAVSSLILAFCFLLAGVGNYPNLLYSALDPDFSLTIYNSISSQKALDIVNNIALLGLPAVLLYTVFSYRLFKGKMKADKY